MKIQYGEAVDDFSAALHAAIDEAAAAKGKGQIAEPSKRLMDDASAYVAANPLKSVGFAVVAALVVGRFIR